nr:hypothetical protein [Burkholderia diffusa]
MLAALAIGAVVIRTGIGLIRRGCAQWPALAGIGRLRVSLDARVVNAGRRAGR